MNLPKGADVFVDGLEPDITLRSGGKPSVISVPAGKHTILVQKKIARRRSPT